MPSAAKIAPLLAPLPPPGLTLFEGFTAQEPKSFKTKTKSYHRFEFFILPVSPEGVEGEPFLETFAEKSKNSMTFKTMDGQEVMTIVNDPPQRHGKRSQDYLGMRPDGTKVWQIEIPHYWKGWPKFSLFKSVILAYVCTNAS